jgi:hypothetical protein
MTNLHWDHDGAAQVVSTLGDAAQAIGAPGAVLGAGAPGGVGPDVERMIDELGATWQRDLGRRAEAGTAVRDALAAQDRAVGGTDQAVTI